MSYKFKLMINYKKTKPMMKAMTAAMKYAQVPDKKALMKAPIAIVKAGGKKTGKTKLFWVFYNR